MGSLNTKIRVEKLFVFMAGLLLMAILHALNSFLGFGIAIITISVFLCIKLKRCTALLFVGFVLLWSNYSIVICQLGLLDTKMTTYVKLNFTPTAFLGLEILFLFMITLYLLLPDIPLNYFENQKIQKSYFSNQNIRKGRYTSLAYLVLISGLLFINVGFFSTTFLGIHIVGKSVYEYSIILFICAIYICTGNANREKLVIVIMAIEIIISFMTRDRIVPLQILILYYLALGQYRIKKTTLIPLMVLFLIMFVFLGNNRIVGATITGNGVIESIQYIIGRKMTLDTAYSAYYCSLTELLFRTTTTLSGRMDLLLHYLMYLLIGGTYSNSKAQLANYVYSLGYIHTYGNVSPLFCYFYLGFFGVLLFALLVAFYSRRVISGRTPLQTAVSLYFTTMSFRWYLYGPAYIIRGAVIFVIIFWIIERITAKEQIHTIERNN